MRDAHEVKIVFSLTCVLRIAATALSIASAGGFAAAIAAEQKELPCNDDAMIVFDASGSMAGNVGQGIATTIPRIDEARHALAEVVPSATIFRRVGLITYGPGPYQQCNVHLDLKPTANAGAIIMRTVNALTPGGRTPLASAVEQAATVLDYKQKPGVIVVVTDGEETCGGAPCDLGKQLHAAAKQLTIHVIGYRVKDFSWTGEQSILDVRCLAEQNGGLYIAAESKEDLIEALRKTLDCPMVTKRASPPPSQSYLDIIRLASQGALHRPNH
jgi:Ca-activated chloride channel family protein